MSENTTVAIIILACAFAFSWCVWAIAVNIRRSRTSKYTAEIHSRLLDRFSGSPELIAFLEGESGRRYFDALESDIKDPLSRVLNGIQLGIVLILLGVSFLAVRTGQTDTATRNSLLLIGVPGIALGTGFLISAIISHRLSKSWGLERNKRQAP
jgi:hypothetical protein